MKHVPEHKNFKETSKNHDLQKMDLKEFTMKKFEYLEPMIMKTVMSINTKIKFNQLELSSELNK